LFSNGLSPEQIRAAYGVSTIQVTSPSAAATPLDGTGETIALIELNSDPSLASDLATFDARYNLPTPALSIVNLAGSQTDAGWSTEQALDVEWAHAIAPGASLIVVQAPASGSATQELQNLLSAVNTARNTPGVVAISMSWGFSEMADESKYDPYFTTPAGHPGVTFIASSGDDGIIEYPATSPNVVAVGGTTLSLGDAGAYASETAWYESGGGYSLYEPEPTYQKPVQQSGLRSTPDVAFDGDPNSGVAVYATDPDTGQGAWQIVGGTSLGAPAWAGLIATVDQGRALVGQPSLDGPTETLPALYAAATTDFHAVAASTGSNPVAGETAIGVFNPFSPPGQTAGAGASLPGASANTATGLGSPVSQNLVSNLIASTLSVPLTTFGPAPAVPIAGPKRSLRHHAVKHHRLPSHKTERPKAHSSEGRIHHPLRNRAVAQRREPAIAFGLHDS
jgi:subtilase family serine protease